MTDLEAMKAAFLAKGGTVSVADAGIAYGVNADADKAKRAEARQQKSLAREDISVQQAERYVDYVRESNGYYKS
jgi:hypothetical protein